MRGAAVGIDQFGKLRRDFGRRIDGTGHGDRRRVAINRNAPDRILERHARQREYRCRRHRGRCDDTARPGHGRGRIGQHPTRRHDDNSVPVGSNDGDEAGQGGVHPIGQFRSELGTRLHTGAVGRGNGLRTVEFDRPGLARLRRAAEGGGGAGRRGYGSRTRKPGDEHLRIRQRAIDGLDFDGRGRDYRGRQTGQSQTVDLEGQCIHELSEGRHADRRPDGFAVGHGNRGRIVQRDRPGFARLRRTGQSRSRLAGRARKGACRFGQIESELRREGGGRPADEDHRGTYLRRDDVATRHRIDLPHQCEGDLLGRIQRDRRATDDQSAADHDLVGVGADGKAPPVIRDRIPAQGDDHGIAGDRRRDAAGGHQGYESHHGVSRECRPAALGDIQGRTGEERREAVRRAGVDRRRKGTPDLGQLVCGRVDLDGVLPAIDADDPAVTCYWRARQGERRRGSNPPGRDRGAHRNKLRGDGKGCRIGQRQAVHGRAQVCRGYLEAVGRRIKRCTQRLHQAGRDFGQRVAGLHRVADRRSGSADFQVQDPFLAEDYGARERNGGIRNRAGRQAAYRARGANLNGKAGRQASTQAIDDDQRPAFGRGCQRARPARRDGCSDPGGDLCRRIDNERNAH